MPRVSTSFVYPPIPLRQFDWCASYEDDEDQPRGYGRTEEEAVADLIKNFPPDDPLDPITINRSDRCIWPGRRVTLLSTTTILLSPALADMQRLATAGAQQ